MSYNYTKILYDLRRLHGLSDSLRSDLKMLEWKLTPEIGCGLSKADCNLITDLANDLILKPEKTSFIRSCIHSTEYTAGLGIKTSRRY